MSTGNRTRLRLQLAPPPSDGRKDEYPPGEPPSVPSDTKRRLAAGLVVVAIVCFATALVVGGEERSAKKNPKVPEPAKVAAPDPRLAPGDPRRPEGTTTTTERVTATTATVTTVSLPGPRKRAPGLTVTGRTINVASARAVDGRAVEGNGSLTRPYPTIDEALEKAQPGDMVSIGPGTYEGFKTVRDGSADAPIRIVGAGAVIKGDGEGHLIDVNHSHVTIENFEITDADILVWVEKARGVRILDNALHGAAGECVRIKYFSTDNEVADNRIKDCGRDFDADDDNKNGEGVYIGTATEQLKRNPTKDPDASDNNWVHDNEIQTKAECVDIKEGASLNLIEDNVCTGGQDEDGAGFSARGNRNTFRGNTSSDHKGAGIRLGGDEDTDGLENIVVGNRFLNNAGFGIKIRRTPQGQICGNEVTGNKEPITEDADDPTQPC